MKVSIITPVYNEPRLQRCLESVLKQKGNFELEVVVVDGKSTDETVDIIEEYYNQIDMLVRESDEGVFDAMNIGIHHANGDIIGILNADDRYADERVLQRVVNQMEETGAKTCYGDLVYVNKSDEIIRYWESGSYQRRKFYFGWMPPHPTFFVRREVYERFGVFDLDLTIGSDYELMLRFLFVNSISTTYIDRVLVRMATGGQSNGSTRNIVRALQDNYRSCTKHNVTGAAIIPFMHLLHRLPQLFRKPSRDLPE